MIKTVIFYAVELRQLTFVPIHHDISSAAFVPIKLFARFATKPFILIDLKVKLYIISNNIVTIVYLYISCCPTTLFISVVFPSILFHSFVLLFCSEVVYILFSRTL